ncbi:MAG: hypothetical protein IT550_13030 [Novosphingobium sp.]|nr:hypothetical protein [Novosphingobium sp.]
MDNLRGHPDNAEGLEAFAGEPIEDEPARELPPAIIGQDERRMQVRAYNLWASMLENRNFPPVEALSPGDLPDFGPWSVLLDFTGGMEDPVIRYLGEKLGAECGVGQAIERLSEVPPRSLLTRITDHYMQILANQAPIGFEAEFVNQRGATILYRGILLPFSSDDASIDFIYGVINWKELADQRTTDELLLEIDQALDARPGLIRRKAPLTEWADSPVDDDGVLDLVTPLEPDAPGHELPLPSFGLMSRREPGHKVPIDLSAFHVGDDAIEVEVGFEEDIAHYIAAQAFDGEPAHDMALADWLASARALAEAARGSEDRSHQALYAAIGRAYDFSIAAEGAPQEFAALVADSGLAMQARAPLTPLVKLVFGADYDKTRLTEYAAALGHAQRLRLGQGTLADFLGAAPGGLKGVVNAERRLRREESGKTASPRKSPREALARKLRKLDSQPLEAIAAQGSEFTLLVARRLQDGEVVLLGEVADDLPLLERAARRLIA